MALEGTIRDFGLPDIFQLIGLQRKTGVLTLKNEKEEITVTFENGMVVNADSAAKRIEDRLGSVLVKQGRVTKERLEDALATQKATLQRLGHILVGQNFITAKDLQEALQVQVTQMVFRVFRWRDGEYHFAPADNVDYDRDNFHPMSADFILMEGIRMVDEWPIIEKKIPSMDIVFRPVVDANLIEVAAGEDELFGGGGKAPSNKIRLSPEEERIFRKVDGVRTVQAVIDSTGMPEFEVCRTLFDLINRNLIGSAGKGTVEAEQGRVQTVVSATPGYVLLGAAVTITLIVGLANLHSPLAVPFVGAYLKAPYDALLADVSRGRLRKLDAAIVAYHLAKKAPPRTLEELAKVGLVDRSYMKDPWSRPYHYETTADGYLLSDDANAERIERVLPRLSP